MNENQKIAYTTSNLKNGYAAIATQNKTRKAFKDRLMELLKNRDCRWLQRRRYFFERSVCHGIVK